PFVTTSHPLPPGPKIDRPAGVARSYASPKIELPPPMERAHAATPSDPTIPAVPVSVPPRKSAKATPTADLNSLLASAANASTPQAQPAPAATVPLAPSAPAGTTPTQ